VELKPTTDGRVSAGAWVGQLPVVHLFEATFRAAVPQTVPALPSTALRGALLRSLKDLACLELERKSCEECPHLSTCAYPLLVERRGERGQELSSPLVLRPEFEVMGDTEQKLEAGAELRFHVGLIGNAGLEHVSLIRAALPVVARRGLGLKPRAHAARPSLSLVSFTRLPPEPLATTDARTCLLEFVTPLRLTVEGSAARKVDAASLWAGVVRRVRTLSMLYGVGAPSLPLEPPWVVEASKTSIVTVRRFSERQQQAMRWPGLVGFARLRLLGDDLDGTWRLLRFIEAAQLGKGTQFGLGAVRCIPVDGQSLS
jgi:hypothetical protein